MTSKTNPEGLPLNFGDQVRQAAGALNDMRQIVIEEGVTPLAWATAIHQLANQYSEDYGSLGIIPDALDAVQPYATDE